MTPGPGRLCHPGHIYNRFLTLPGPWPPVPTPSRKLQKIEIFLSIKLQNGVQLQLDNQCIRLDVFQHVSMFLDLKICLFLRADGTSGTLSPCVPNARFPKTSLVVLHECRFVSVSTGAYTPLPGLHSTLETHRHTWRRNRTQGSRHSFDQK